MRPLLIALHAVLGASPVGAGAALARDSSGGSMTFEVEWLRGSPFANYRIPGLFLALVIGTTNLVSALWLWQRRPLAPLLSLGAGALLVAWVAVQTLIIGVRHWTQAMWWGVFVLVTALADRGAPHLSCRERGDEVEGRMPCCTHPSASISAA